MNQLISLTVDRLEVNIFPNRNAMGEAAGQAVAARMKELLKEKREIYPACYRCRSGYSLFKDKSAEIRNGSY